MSCKPRQINKFLSFFGIALGGTISFGTICIHRGDESFYSRFLMPIVSRFVDPEFAHEACIFLTKHKLLRCRDSLNSDQASKLKVNILNLPFQNPVGVAAGFDKNSEAVFGIDHYGVGFVEVGTVTPKSQEGNPKKRIFRIRKDEALINRCGFNNKGIEFVKNTLSQVDTFRPMLVGLNLGKNKDTEHLSSDYIIGLDASKELTSVDYYVINISSPNTPGLRDSQDKKNLDSLLTDVLAHMSNLAIKKPLFIKVAPDLDDNQIKDIADLVTSKKCGDAKVSGLILTNTTITRPSNDDIYGEKGGLSGSPLRDISTEIIRKFYRHTSGKIPIIGVGGVTSGKDAYDKIKAGASLIQLYTGLTYEGPPIINKIKRELAELIERDQLSSINEAIGLDHKVKQ